ncbi:La domain family protein [Niveomyces insectorum RCEF 264]|uniref:La domain family protein n=1 Tax=Niveomyces insectorum RCEF 264 TaxID=1081102 RepID=A0A162MBD3_9HYPO|nr:La domain family protein [Niveomyces insectorum RCEF 264]
MSAASFSYAQAARGQSTTPQTTTPAVFSPVPALSTSSQDKDDAGSATSPLVAASSTLFSVNDASRAPTKHANTDASSSPRKVAVDVSSPAVSSTLAGTLADSGSTFSLDDASSTSALKDKNGRISTPDARSPSSDDIVKKGGWRSRTANATSKESEQPGVSDTKDKDKEPAKIELAPAPLPAVNVWNQRMLEQAAKAKQIQTANHSSAATTTTTATTASAAVIRTASVAAPTTNGGVRPKDARKISSATAEGETSPESSATMAASVTKPLPRRPYDNTRAGGEEPRRNGSRGSRTADKEEKATTTGRDLLPPVQDATLWPTPESAAGAEEPKSSKAPLAAEKVDTIEKDGVEEAGTLKTRKKGWLPLPFVPTVNFQTPIPNVRGSKPKSSGRGGRESSSRGGHNAGANGTVPPSEKAAFAASFSAADKATTEPREGTKESSGSVLPVRPSSHSSGPPKRFSTDAARDPSREPRKSSSAVLPDKPKEAALEFLVTPSKSDFVPKGNHVGVVNGDGSGQSPYTPHFGHSDRRFSKNGDNHGSLGRDSGAHQPKEQHGQAFRDRAEARGERSSRGGGFRGGRGGHSGGGAVQSHYVPHSTYQPNGQRSAPNTGFNNSSTTALPPTATPFSPPPQQFSFGNTHSAARSGVRSAGRAQPASQPSASFGSRVQNGVNGLPRLHNHAPHMAPSVSADVQMQPFSFPVFNPYMDSELLHGLTLQVEYYFSLDNLCKDVFLRRKMNDYGFVPLSVIAKFKRMAELAPSLDFIRAACEQSDALDYIVDQDQNEWIRSRHLWNNFILPPEERDEEARKPGPDLRTVFFRSSPNRPPQAYLPTMGPAGYSSLPQPMFPVPYPGSGNELVYPAYDNGMRTDHAPAPNGNADLNGRPPRGESQLSAAVPDFSPGGLSGAPTTLEDYQTYPDEQVEKLVVLVGSDADVLANASSTDQSRGTALGASGGSRGLHERGPSTNDSNDSPDKTSDASPAGEPPLADAVAHAVGEEPYPELRAKAFEQRKHAKSGETPAGMKHLYSFWSHCLPDKFNVRMYDDFRSSALEDARRSPPNDYGLRCLLRYYNHVLFGTGSTKPYPAVFTPHHAEARQLSDSLKPRVNGEFRA